MSKRVSECACAVCGNSFVLFRRRRRHANELVAAIVRLPSPPPPPPTFSWLRNSAPLMATCCHRRARYTRNNANAPTSLVSGAGGKKEAAAARRIVDCFAAAIGTAFAGQAHACEHSTAARRSIDSVRASASYILLSLFELCSSLAARKKMCARVCVRKLQECSEWPIDHVGCEQRTKKSSFAPRVSPPPPPQPPSPSAHRLDASRARQQPIGGACA